MSNAATQDSLDVMAPIYTTPAPPPAVDPDVIVQYGKPAPEKKPAASQQVINITTQEQFDALPDYQKEIIRAQAAGVSIPAKYQEQLAVDAIKQNLKPESKAGTIEVVKDPVTGEDIRVFNSSDGSAHPMPRRSPTQLERVVADDGTVMMVDPYSGKSFPAWDNQTGQPVVARTSNQSGNDDVRLRRMMLQNKLDQANKSVLDYEQRVARGDTPWHSGLPLVGSGATYENDLRAALAARDELTRQMGQLGAASAPATQDTMPTADMPPPEPAQTPQPTPPPTPQQTPQPPDPRPMPPQRSAGMPPDGSIVQQGGKTYIIQNGQPVEAR